MTAIPTAEPKASVTEPNLADLVTYVGSGTREPFKFLIYGPPGVGKTTLAAQAPKPLILDLDFGTEALEGREAFKGIPYIKISGMQQLGRILKRLREGELPTVETIVLDNLGELQKLQLSIRLQAEAQKDSSKDPNLAEWTDYRANTEIMRKMMLSFRDLNRNLIFTCHSEVEKDETGRQFWAPAMTPKVRETCLAIMDLVGYLTTPDYAEDDDPTTTRRLLQVHPSRTVLAKSRLQLPRILKNPTFDDILKGRR